MSGTPNPSLNAWRLERIHAGEPDAAAAARAAQALGPADRDRLAALAADDAATLSALPPAAVAAEVARRLHRAQVAAQEAGASQRPAGGRLLGARRWLGGLAVAGAALALWIARPVSPDGDPHGAPGLAGPGLAGPGPDAHPDPDTVRAKGGEAEVLVFRQRGPAEPELLTDGAAAQAGDAVQLGWRLAAPVYGVLVSFDGAGAVTVHHAAGAQAARLEAGRHVLDHAFVLDAAPAYEQFVLVTAETPFAVAAVAAAARAVAGQPVAAPTQGPLALPASLRQTTLRLRKETRL